MQEKKQEIEFVEFLKLLLRKWWLIVGLMVIFGAGSYYYTVNYMTPVYQARTTLFVGKDSAALAGISIGELSLGNQLVGDYSELIKSTLVTEEVINDLELNQTSAMLVENLNVNAVPDTRFIYVTFEDPIPERAQLVTNKLSEVLAAKAEEIVGVKNVTIVDYAALPTGPVGPNVNRNVMMAAILGLMLAGAIIIAMMLMDNTVHEEREIEKMLGVPVLGAIPKFKGASRS